MGGKQSRGGNVGSAEWAIGIILQPNVDAINVEEMGTIGNNSQHLIFFKFAQTNRTFG